MVTPASVPIVTYLIELSGQVPIPASGHDKPSCYRHAKKLPAIVRAREPRAGRWPQKTARNKSRTLTAAIDVVGTMLLKHIILLICYVVVVACCLTCITG